MKGKTWRAGFGAVLLAALSACGEPQGLPAALTTGAARGFHVVLVTLDTTRADRLGCYGYAQARTPIIDGLAARGVRFADAVSAAPMTLPSHATILTGLLPPNHGVRENGEFVLGAEQATLAEVLSSEGYATAAFVSAFVLDARFGLDQGFERYDDALAGGAAYGDFNERSAADVTDAATTWLRARSSEQPFLLWVHYFDPHFPYEPPAAVAAGEPYDGEIASVDRELGRLVTTLEDADLLDRTVFLLVADHGESLGEHGESTHGMLLYDAVMRVPLILSVPGLLDGGTVVADGVAATMDIVPTLCDLLGVRDTTARDGTSLLQPGWKQGRSVYMEALAPYFESGWSPLYGLRRHEDKFVLAPSSEYYDLAKDPDERNNLYGASDRRPEWSALETRLDGLLGDWPTIQAVAASSVPLDPAATARLEALGYVDGVAPEDREGLADPKRMLSVLSDVGRSETLIEQGKLAEALTLIEAIETKSPRHRRVLINKATVLALLGRTDEAKTTLYLHNAIRPSADSELLLAQLLIQEGAHAEAARVLDRAEAIDPYHGGIQIARGDSLAATGRLQEALAAFARAIEVDPYRVRAAAEKRIERARARLR